MTKKVPGGLRELETAHLKCRSLQHAWDPKGLQVIYWDRKQARSLRLECLRCAGERIDIMLWSTGELVSRVYHHPKNYLIEDVPSWGGRREFNNNVRRELYGRLSKKGKK